MAFRSQNLLWRTADCREARLGPASAFRAVLAMAAVQLYPVWAIPIARSCFTRLKERGGLMYLYMREYAAMGSDAEAAYRL